MPDNPSLSQVSASSSEFIGRRVRWGGRVESVEYQSAGAVIKVWEMKLGSAGRPLVSGGSDGRFIAKIDSSIKASDYKGQQVTVIGTIEGEETKNVAGGESRSIVVRVDVVHFWQRNLPPLGPYNPYYQGTPVLR